MTTPYMTWDDFPGPNHSDEVMAAHDGSPSIAVQNATHGAGLPRPDHGPDPMPHDTPPGR